jgi:transposase
MQLEARMLRQPRLDFGRLVGRIVVEHQMHVARLEDGAVDAAQECQELLRPVSRHAFSDDHTRLHIERCEQRRGAVALVIVGHRSGAPLLERQRGRLIGRTKGGLNSKLHVLADAKGRPIHMFLSAGQTSDYIGARALLSSIPKAGSLLADRGYDADWFRSALIEMGISPCIPSRAGRKDPIQHDTDLYRQRHKIENMFARLKDWRRIATRYDRCPILFLSACALAATVIYWL